MDLPYICGMKKTFLLFMALLAFVIGGATRFSDTEPQNAPVHDALYLIAHGDTLGGIAVLEGVIEDSRIKNDVYMAAAEYLVEYRRGQDSTSEDYRAALKARTNYQVRVDSLLPPAFIELAQFDIRQGEFAAAKANLEIALASCTNHTDAQLQQIAALYSAIPLNSKSYVPAYLWCLVALVFVVLAIAAFTCFKRTRKLNLLENSTENTGNDCVIRFSAILQQLLEIAVNAELRSREFNILAERKLAAGQSKDLYELLSSGKQAVLNRERFFESFDKLMRETCSDLPQRINALLKPDKQLEFGERLTPEERIALFLSFGIDNSTVLAQVLGLSLNTVYTYRNRLKGRAENRADFEEELRKLLLK